LIEPLVSEDDWLGALQDAVRWIPPNKKTLVISPHPDDETLGVGGLIAQQQRSGIPVLVVAVTDGEAAYPNSKSLAKIRQLEQERAVKALGVEKAIMRLQLPDSAVSKHESNLRSVLKPLIDADTLVLAPWGSDWHPDHEACARAAQQVCEEVGAELMFYLFWTWHQRTVDVFDGVSLRCFELNAPLQAVKNQALNCHRSQLQNESCAPILPELLLAPARRPFEIFISHV
jgi:LmbE family N-acetylglucosaminyl deacetylase